MKILYGVQGTGNGHITRANAISDALNRYEGVEVDWIVSGREPNDLFQVNGDHRYFRGLTFETSNGRVDYFRTLWHCKFLKLGQDIYRLKLQDYDCLVTDYEPVLSWAAKLKGQTTIGIGHQYAFQHDIPVRGANPANLAILRHFAPADQHIGLHWHHFDQLILPPICDVPNWNPEARRAEKVVVYLPFEEQQKVIEILKPISNYEFYLYGPGLKDRDLGHIQTRALSRHGFKQDLITASAVITNSGFELISECLVMGIKVLTKPLYKQVEQLSNAEALARLKYATVTDTVSSDICRDWLRNSESVLITYPRVHKKIAHWLATGREASIANLRDELWQEVQVIRGDHRTQIKPEQMVASG